ncbi:MAG TPA: hypothetical protein VGN88_09140 [Phycisphaerae bacterium]
MKRHFLRPLSLLALGALLSSGGCSFFTGEKKVAPPPIEYTIFSPYQGVRTIAIAPAINLSGSRDFDPLVVSDILYAEMQQVQGLNVLPLNKTIIAMQRLGIRSLDDVKSVQRLAEFMGADDFIVPAVTAYDPYNPPTVGMVLQLYTPASHAAAAAPPLAAEPQHPWDPQSIKLTNTVQSNPSHPMIAVDVVTPAPAAPLPSAPLAQPVVQVAAVFNATNQTVLRELHVFAAGRTQYDSALMDQKFLADADSYMRFVCHAMTRRLMDVERDRLSDR